MPLELRLVLSDEDVQRIAQAVAEKMGAVAPKPMTIAQFAERVGESKSTIRRKVDAGVITKLPHPGDIKISVAELTRYVGAKKP
jgi:hypothetical protein